MYWLMNTTGATARHSSRRKLASVGMIIVLVACTQLQQPKQELTPPAGPVAGAATQALEVHPVPGFLPAPGLLRPGSAGEATMMYVNPAVDLSSFTNVMLDPVQLWTAPGAPLAQLPPSQRQAVTNLFFSELLSALQRRCRVVQQPRLNTLRFHFSLVDVSVSNPTPAATANYAPYSGHRYDPSSIGFGKAVGEFTVSATMEGYARDARTRILVWQGVDKREVSSVPSADAVTSWGDVHKIFASWANDIANKLRQQQICP